MSDTMAKINRNIIGATVLVSLLLFVLLGTIIFTLAGIRSELMKQTAAVTADDRWEYDVIGIKDDEWTTKATALGEAGWEIVTARRASDSNDVFGYECIVRRKKS